MELSLEEFQDVLIALEEGKNEFKHRPRFDYKTGTYSCPGYRDDEDYKNCHSSFTKA